MRYLNLSSHGTRAQEHKSTRAGIATANSILKKNISSINTVAEWASAMEYNNGKTFARKYREEFGTKPKAALVKIKLNYAVQLLKKNPEISCYEVARAIGKSDEKSLNFFFNTHLNRAPGTYKSKE